MTMTTMTTTVKMKKTFEGTDDDELDDAARVDIAARV